MKPYDKLSVTDSNIEDYILTTYKGGVHTISENKLKNINPLLQTDYGEDNDCTLTSITTAISYYRNNEVGIQEIYNNVEYIARKHGYNGKRGTFSITIKSIYEKALTFFRCKRQKTNWCVFKPFISINKIMKAINDGQPVILNLLNDGRHYYHNHTVLVVGYKGVKINNEKDLKYFLQVYDNWNKETTYIDWQKLGYIFSINF